MEVAVLEIVDTWNYLLGNEDGGSLVTVACMGLVELLC